MRKDKLIKKLQQIDGNPDILLWNGFVGDWMDIGNFVEDYLTRQTKEHYIESCRWEVCVREQNFDAQLSLEIVEKLNKDYNKHNEWDTSRYVTQADIKKGWYKLKRVVFINAKQRGVKTFDRLGTCDY